LDGFDDTVGVELGFVLGTMLGVSLGCREGKALGIEDGCLLGKPLGIVVGYTLGTEFGTVEGATGGFMLGMCDVEGDVFGFRLIEPFGGMFGDNEGMTLGLYNRRLLGKTLWAAVGIMLGCCVINEGFIDGIDELVGDFDEDRAVLGCSDVVGVPIDDVVKLGNSLGKMLGVSLVNTEGK
jgi:hypothetical protein